MNKRVANGTLSLAVQESAEDNASSTDTRNDETPRSIHDEESLGRAGSSEWATQPGAENLNDYLSVIETLIDKSSLERDCLEKSLRCVLLITSVPLAQDAEQSAVLAIDVPDGALELHWLRRRTRESDWIGTSPRDEHWPTLDSLDLETDVRTRFLDELAAGILPSRSIEVRAVVVGNRIFVPGESVGTN